MRKLFALIATFAVTAVIGFSPLVTTQAANGSSFVSFTGGRALNPIDPSLPLDYDTGKHSDLPDTSAEKEAQVVVNTTPEKKTAVTQKATTKTATPAPTRQTLPQTGSVEMPVILALVIVIASLGMAAWVLKPKQNVALN